MDIQNTQVAIPEWNGKNGNFKKGRIYYNGPRIGQGATIDKFIYHWMDGTLASTDKTFQNPNRIASSNFGVEDTTVHQYVSIQDTSFNSGVGTANCESISIEHSAQPGRDASEATYETSARLVFSVAKSLGKKVGDFQHLPHNHFVATACPGTLDIDRIVRKAMQLEGEDLMVVPASATINVPVLQEGHVINRTGANVRLTPNTALIALRTMSEGQGFWYVTVVSGEKINGNGIWLLLEDGHYVWSGATNYQFNQHVS